MTDNKIKYIDKRKGIKIETIYDLNNQKDKKIIQDKIKNEADWYYSLYMSGEISAQEYEDTLHDIGYYDPDIWE